ncbi:hypothetical protein BJ994_001017 [Arthrobacter pigmenti]|uniref:Uncharacterized protein n=1 Tax=Arthrobacter pigmenti TaxID=271432 RepID=A0A846RUJ4_9MICC|nr:hypothetical protein [Arthrobacter pigmenti]NJC21941.1 hypothetical protein [Arthrobacter pigmenti]
MSFVSVACAGARRTWLGTLAIFGVVLLVVLTFLLPPTPGAHAGPVGGGWNRAAGLDGAEHFVGQHVNSDGVVAYCTDFERLSPPHADRYDGGHAGAFTRSDGTQLSAKENAALSYLLHRWGNTTDNATAASVQLAVWALTSPGMQWDSAGMARVLTAERLPVEVVERSRAMTRTALSEAGPYQVRIKLKEEGADGVIAALIEVAGADGTPASGLAASVKLTGAFAFQESAARTWTTSDQPRELTLKRTGFGSGALTVSVPRTPAAGVKWLVPSRKDVQRLLTAAVVEPRDAAAAIADLPAFRPAVQTQTSAARTDVGTSVHDVLEVSAGDPSAESSADAVPWMSMPPGGEAVSVEVVSTLWGPLDAPPVLAENVPAGTPAVGTVTTRVDGPGTYSTPTLTVPAPGWYVWTETIDPGSAKPAEAAAYVMGWQGKYGIAAETTFVPWLPQVQTTLSAHEAQVGDSVTDGVTLQGFGTRPEGSPGTVLLSMYGPFSEPPVLDTQVPADAPLHSESGVPALNGTHTSGQFAPLMEPGCYTVVARYPGDEYTNAFVSPFGEPSETVCVHQPATPVEPSAPEAEVSPEPEPSESADAAPAETVTPPAAPPAATQPRPELAQTGLRTEVAAGAAMALVGTGLALVQLTSMRRRRART